MLAPLRRLFVTLLGVAACTPVLAEDVGNVQCVVDGDRVICSGTGSVIVEYPVNVTITTNVVGTCTNCVAMTPEYCQLIKSQIKSSVDSAMDLIGKSYAGIYSAKTQLESLKDEGDSFVGPELYGPAGISASEGKASPQFSYASYATPSVDMGGRSVTYIGTANNSIANYYQQGVKPVVDDVLSSLDSHLEELDNAGSSVYGIYDLINGVNCSACTASFGDGGGGGGGGGSCSDCPCKEQMQALHDLLEDDFLPRIKNIDTNVAQLTNLLAIAEDQLRVTKEGFHNVTNLFNRLDDYVLDDFSNKVYQIRVDVNYIASNLAAQVRNLFIDNQYSNATFYTSIDGWKHIEISDLDDTLITDNNGNKSFDWQEYKDLTWFERIEFMLLHMGGFYSLTNSISGGTTNYNSVQTALDNSSGGLKSVLDGSEQDFDSVKTSFTAFNSAVRQAFGGDRAQNPGRIYLIENFLNTGNPLTLEIDSNIVSAARVVTSLLWTALFAVVGFKVVLFCWNYTIYGCSFLLRTFISSIK